MNAVIPPIFRMLIGWRGVGRGRLTLPGITRVMPWLIPWASRWAHDRDARVQPFFMECAAKSVLRLQRPFCLSWQRLSPMLRWKVNPILRDSVPDGVMARVVSHGLLRKQPPSDRSSRFFPRIKSVARASDNRPVRLQARRQDQHRLRQPRPSGVSSYSTRGGTSA